ncbi:putative tRNA sulfurtransferase [Paraliobacillus quinghaiensis]|uniref:Probable tRNA sulfurtransferase n=1 Tax=Paraliobacillus quinghaiensis TaxID=470815 RepID=A0A917TKE4_9BACI|nr:tRNA uracil 4-sulfurtransferase ThiI [Paraliobacillus quinghaiensis]GGM26501.1 putative tRNA sulfurtransferase [Paraliobacillus quinghaiensis]
MHYDHIVIRYGELALKGKNRKIFIHQLHENVRDKLHAYPNVKIKNARDRMTIMLNGEDPSPIIEKCKVIFGIQSLSLAIRVDNDVELIKEAALFALNKALHVKTFKITTKRANKEFPIGSQEFNHVVGTHLLTNTTDYTVDVHKPDLELHIDIRKDATYITSQKIKGAGGLPVGTAGKSLLLLSGGIDSPVAGYLAMNRGVQIEAVHFHSPPYTSEAAKQKVLDLAKELTKYGKKVKVHIVPFTALQSKIHREIPYGYSMTVMRRMMLRISERIADNEGILSLITGESLGQVASQTMQSMHAINDVTRYPVLRPLIAMDKESIISIAEKIDTYNISIRPYDDCCTLFVPKAPKTKPKRDKVVYFEEQMDIEKEMQDIFDGIKVVTVSHNTKAIDPMDDLF